MVAPPRCDCAPQGVRVTTEMRPPYGGGLVGTSTSERRELPTLPEGAPPDQLAGGERARRRLTIPQQHLDRTCARQRAAPARQVGTQEHDRRRVDQVRERERVL